MNDQPTTTGGAVVKSDGSLAIFNADETDVQQPIMITHPDGRVEIQSGIVAPQPD